MLAVEAGGPSRAARVRLADRSGALDIELAAGLEAPGPGDVIACELRWTQGEQPTAVALDTLTPFRHEAPFPSPQHEYARLHAAATAADASEAVAEARAFPPTLAQRLRLRARALAAVRAFFDERAYLECDTPRRVRSPGLEPEIEAVPSGERFLLTSPEYHLKRLLAGGLERIYSLGPCFRGSERGPQHLGEFTMLEWYRAYATLEQLAEDTEALVVATAEAIGSPLTPLLRRRPFARRSVAALLAEHAGVELAGAERDAALLAERAARSGVVVDEATRGRGYAAVFSRVWVERVEPALGEAPLFVTEFPAPLAALSRCDPARPDIARRFELYAGGLELANAFDELRDPAEQRARFERERAERRAAGRPAHPVDERFVAALEQGLPPTCGIALGFDRLLMLLTAAPDIARVVPFAPEDV